MIFYKIRKRNFLPLLRLGLGLGEGLDFLSCINDVWKVLTWIVRCVWVWTSVTHTEHKVSLGSFKEIL